MSGMKLNTIKAVLHSKITDWISTIDDTEVAEAARKDTLVSGGAISSMLGGEKVNDYDVYFKTYETTLKIAEYYARKFNEIKGQLKTTAASSCNPEVKTENRTNVKNEVERRILFYMKSAGIASDSQEEYKYFESESETSTDAFVSSLFEDEVDPIVTEETIVTAEELVTEIRDKKTKYKPIFFSENAVTLSNKVQLVVRFYGKPEEIHTNYDYAHSMCCYEYNTGNLNIHEDALSSILSKSLIYNGSLYPVASVFRIRKFLKRGWRISAGQILKILVQISQIDLTDKTVLREQLIGVDQAYMSQLMRALESSDQLRIDTTYLAKVIDEIFE